MLFEFERLLQNVFDSVLQKGGNADNKGGKGNANKGDGGGGNKSGGGGGGGGGVGGVKKGLCVSETPFLKKSKI